MTENKVKFGLKNVHFALIQQGEDGAITFGTPKRIPGAVNLSLAAQGESTESYADDILYYATAANTGYQGDLEIARVPQSFRVDVLREQLDAESGVMFENAALEPAPFALLFEFNGDVNATRHISGDGAPIRLAALMTASSSSGRYRYSVLGPYSIRATAIMSRRGSQ